MKVNQILTGDSWTLSGDLDDESIGCIVTSPPYWGLRDYGAEGQCGLETHPQEWVDKMVDLFERLKPKLKDTGTVWINLGQTFFAKRTSDDAEDEKYGEKQHGHPMPMKDVPESNWLQPKQMMLLPERFAISMQDKGWICRNAIVWHKPNAMPTSVKDRFGLSHETIYLFVKNPKYFFNLDAVREPHKYPLDVLRSSAQDKAAGVSPFAKDNDVGVAWRHDQVKAKFNLRVPDAQRGGPERRLGVKASAEEIASYDEKARMTKQERHPNRQIAGFNKRWKESMGGGGSGFQGHRGNLDQDGNSLLHPAGKNPGDVWRITTVPHPFAHFAVYPEELVERCIKAGCPKDGLVLDPFMGSGTTGVVAKRLGRNYIGFELNVEYAKLAELRLKGFDMWREQGKNAVVTQWVEIP